jgi:hypothetical protein
MLSLVFGFLALSCAANGARIVSSLPANASADYVIVGGGLSGASLLPALATVRANSRLQAWCWPTGCLRTGP